MARKPRDDDAPAGCQCDRLMEVPMGKAVGCPVHGTVWVPCCWGSLYDLDGCTCEKRPRAGRLELLERKVQKLQRLVEQLRGVEPGKGEMPS